MEGNTQLSKPKAYLVPVIITLMLGVLLFLPAGSFRFWQAWIFLSGSAALTFFITAYFLRKSPELLSRRMKFKEKEPAQKAITYLSNLALIGYIVPGLDYRFHWSAVPVPLVIAGNAFVFIGYLFIFFVFKENSYASTVIQVEKEQQVITTGPYTIVRHPMYLGLLLMNLFTPFALGSYWAIIPFLFGTLFLVLRIRAEETMLLRDLPGYRDYCNRARYRLIPRIW